MIKNTKESVWKKIDIKNNNECWNWIGCLNHDGYGEIKINYKKYLVHRVVYELIYDSIPDGLLVLHKCNNPSCCNSNHLYIGTHEDNMKQMTKDLRQAYKLSPKNILEIRNLYSTGNYSQRKLGDMFNVDHSTIGDVISKKTGRYI